MRIIYYEYDNNRIDNYNNTNKDNITIYYNAIGVLAALLSRIILYSFQ